MRLAHKTQTMRQAAALALGTLVCAWGIGCCPTPSFAEEAGDGASVPAEAGSAENQAGQTESYGPVIQLYSSGYSAVSDDPNLQDVKTQACYTVSFPATSDLSSRDAMYDAIDAVRANNGVGPVVRDAGLEEVAFQRASESVLLHSTARPDGTLYFTAGSRAVNELLAWGTPADNVAPEPLMARLTWGDRDAELDWVLGATNVGCVLLVDEAGNTHWALEFAYDSLPPEGNRPAAGAVTCYVNIASSCVKDVALPKTVELKGGESLEVPVQATAGGTIAYGEYTANLSDTPVTVMSWCFIWNTSNTRVATVTSDGTLTGVSAGTVTVSATDQDSSNPRFTSAVVDGGAKSTVYNLADCTVMGITGDDGLGNLYLNAQGGVDMPAFQIATPTNAVIDPVNYTASIAYDAATRTAKLTVKAKAESSVCKGTVTRTFTVVEAPADAAASEASDEGGATDAPPEGADGTDATQPGTQVDGEPASAGQPGGETEAEPQAEPQTEPQAQPAEDEPAGETVHHQQDIQGATLTLSFSSNTFTGLPVQPSGAELSLNGTVLEQGRDYTLSYADNVNVGQATATATGTGNYTGSVTVSFPIRPADLSLASVTMPNAAYTGTHLFPKPISAAYVYGGSAVSLTEGVDYEVVSYKGNLEVGDAKAVLEGKGNFTGTLDASWKVVPAGTQDVGTTQTIPHASSDSTPLGTVVVAALVALLAAAAVAIAILVRRLIHARN